ncbi:hypothetical protein SAMN04244571_04716, partial [Azotobacter beijerinckii]
MTNETTAPVRILADDLLAELYASSPATFLLITPAGILCTIPTQRELHGNDA